METINDKLFTQPSCKFKFLSKEGFNIPKFYDLNTYDDVINVIKNKSSAESVFKIKGIVQEVDEYSDELPSVYFDFVNTKRTILNKILWVLNVDGVLIPTAKFDVVTIDGSKYSTCSLNNALYLESLIINDKLAIGDEIIIVLKDDNIPYILGVSTHNGGAEIDMPNTCPSCKEKFEIFNSKIICNNTKCNSKVVYVLENYLELLNDEIFTKPLLLKLINEYNINSIHDLKCLNENEISKFSTDALDIVHLLKQVHKVSKNQFLNLLQPPNNGVRVMSHIIDTTPLSVLLDTNTLPSDIFDISIVDATSQEALTVALQQQLNTIQLNAKYFNIDGTISTNSIEGKIFCFTNTMKEKSMKDYKEMVVEAGGVIGNITQKLDFLVSNELEEKTTKFNNVVKVNNKLYNGGKTHSINVLTEQELIKLMEQ